MAIKEKDVKKFLAIGLIALLAVVAFLIIKPIALSIIAGLLLAYMCYPIYKFAFKFLREKNTSALATCVIIVVILFIPLWFLMPIAIRQLFDAFNFLQTLDVASFIKGILPSSSAQLNIDVTTTIVSFMGKVSTYTLSSLTNLLLDLPTVLLHSAVIIFVFFFAMRDADKLKSYVKGLSPIKKEKSAEFTKQFREITNGVVYGNFIIGVVQGIATGIGLLIFGVPHALLLTLFAIIAAILPIVGPWLIWVPAAIYLFAAGSTGAGIGFTIYSIIIVSTIDNFLRPYLVSRRTKSASVVVLMGMIGGLIVFGPLGLLIGPLILEYVVLFLDAYKNKALSDIFEE